MTKEIIWRVMHGQDLILQAKVPNKIVRRFTSEVVFFQKELDVILRNFNKRIEKLQGEGAPQAKVELDGNGEKKQKMTEEQKAIVLKKIQDEKKKGGGGIPL